MLSATNQVPGWITLVVILAVFVALLYIENKIRKQNLTRRVLLVAVSESTSAVYLVFIAFNVFYQWVTEGSDIVNLFRLPDNSLVMAFCFLVLFADTFKKTKNTLHRSKSSKSSKRRKSSKSRKTRLKPRRELASTEHGYICVPDTVKLS
jgi:glucan phosphoethanolaminetransferase (alkaline phosphatase superfamily)